MNRNKLYSFASKQQRSLFISCSFTQIRVEGANAWSEGCGPPELFTTAAYLVSSYRIFELFEVIPL